MEWERECVRKRERETDKVRERENRKGKTLTLQTVCVEKVLTLFMTLDPALWAAHALASDAPQQALALMAVCGSSRRPHLKIMRRGGGYRVD